MQHYQAANELFIDEEYDEALVKYNLAIEKEEKPEFFIKRAACHIKLKNFMKALQDANKAIKLEPNNATAYLRQGIAYFELEEYESAKKAFETSRKISDQAQVRRWIRKCDAEISFENGEEEAEEPAVESKAEETPAATETKQPEKSDSHLVKELADFPPPKQSIRHEWYQSPTYVVISIFAKGIQKEQCEINSTATTLAVTIKLNENSEFVLDLDLCDTICPEQTQLIIAPSKVEIKMVKDKQCKWLALEKTADPIATLTWDTSTPSGKPEYPSSSKIKKNWDAIDKSVEEDKPEGDAALNKLFQDIFARGSDEQKRAMEKSYVESGGTVLSTNWEDVGARKVEGTPPKGVEMRKWSDLSH